MNLDNVSAGQRQSNLVRASGVHDRRQQHHPKHCHNGQGKDGVVRSWVVIGFSPAPIRYPILGLAGCLQYFDARFRGEDRIIELEINRLFPGTIF